MTSKASLLILIDMKTTPQMLNKGACAGACVEQQPLLIVAAQLNLNSTQLKLEWLQYYCPTYPTLLEKMHMCMCAGKDST